MNYPPNPYVLPSLLGAITAALLGIFILHRRPARGATPSVLVMLAAAVWSLGYALELGSGDLSGRIFWSKVEYFGIASAPLAWLAFALEYTGRARFLSRRNLALLAIIPALTLLFVWTNESHGLIWSDFELDTHFGYVMSKPTRALGFYVHSAYEYALLLTGTLLLLQALLRSASLYRGQTAALLIATLVPWLGNFLTIAGRSPFPRLDLTPFSFTLSGAVLAWGVFRYRLLDIVPIARDIVIENIRDGVIVLDAQNRIVDINRAAQAIVAVRAEQAIGQDAAQVFADYGDLVRQYQDVSELHTEITSGVGEAQRWMDLQISPLYGNEPGQLRGRILLLRDITRRKRTDQLVVQRVQELDALRATVLDITKLQDLPTLLHMIVVRAAELTGASGGELYLCEPAEHQLEAVVSYNTKRDSTGTVLKYGEGAAGAVAQTGRPLIIDDYSSWVKRAATNEEGKLSGAVLSVPMNWQGAVIGVILVLNAKGTRSFTRENQDLLALFASHAAIAVESARLLRRVQQELQDRERAEQALRTLNDELEKRVAERTEELTQVNAALTIEIRERRQAEEKLEQREQRFRALVENSWDLVAVVDAEGAFQYISPSATLLFDRSPEELAGRNAFDFVHPEDAAQLKATFESLLQAPGEAVSLTTRILPRSDLVRWIALSVKNMLREPAVRGVVVNVRDVTAQKLAELETHKRNEQLSALSQMGLTVTTSLDLDSVLHQITSALLPLFKDVEGITILLQTPDGLQFAAVGGSAGETLRGVRMPSGKGVAGYVLRTGRPLLVSSDRDDAPIYREIEEISRYHTESLLAVPLRLGQQVIGVLEAVHRRPHAFSEDDLHLLESAAQWAAIAIGNARTYRELERRLAESQALSGIGRALNETLQLDSILQLIADSPQRVIPSVNKCVIHLYDDRASVLVAAAVAGLAQKDRALTMQVGHGVAGRVLKDGPAIRISDTRQDARYVQTSPDEPGRSLVVVPIQTAAQRFGTISIESVNLNAFTEDDVALLTSLGAMAAAAIENARLYSAEREARALAEALRDATAALSSSIDFDTVLDTILASVSRVVQFDLADIMLIDPATGRTRVVRCHAPKDTALEATSLKFQVLPSGVFSLRTMLGTQRPIVIPDTHRHPEWLDFPPTRWIASYVGAPITVHGQVVGFINADSKSAGFYTAEDAERLHAFANQAAAALENAQLYRHLEEALSNEQKTRAQLVQSDKLAALGRMTATVAHEINNPLQTIKNCLYLLKPALRAAEDLEVLEVVESETDRLSGLVEQLRATYRPGSGKTRIALRLRDVLEQVHTLVTPYLRDRHVVCTADLPSADLIVNGDANQLKQVFLNLAMNAADAAKSEGGKLAIGCCVERTSSQVGIRFQDSGPGIPAEDLSHVFEPFFTTKESGMGLGLAICYDIIRSHAGHIQVESTLGQGSTFTVWLPMERVSQNL